MKNLVVVLFSLRILLSFSLCYGAPFIIKLQQPSILKQGTLNITRIQFCKVYSEHHVEVKVTGVG